MANTNSLFLTPGEATMLADLINRKANEAYSQGQTELGRKLDDLGYRFSSTGLWGSVFGYDDEDVIELCYKRKPYRSLIEI